MSDSSFFEEQPFSYDQLYSAVFDTRSSLPWPAPLNVIVTPASPPFLPAFACRWFGDSGLLDLANLSSREAQRRRIVEGALQKIASIEQYRAISSGVDAAAASRKKNRFQINLHNRFRALERADRLVEMVCIYSVLLVAWEELFGLSDVELRLLGFVHMHASSMVTTKLVMPAVLAAASGNMRRTFENLLTRYRSSDCDVIVGSIRSALLSRTLFSETEQAYRLLKTGLEIQQQVNVFAQQSPRFPRG